MINTRVNELVQKENPPFVSGYVSFGQHYARGYDGLSFYHIGINCILWSSDEFNTLNARYRYLGYDYSLTGIIFKGKQLGRTIGYPTANITIEEDYKLIPNNGVYIAKSVLNGKTVFGMMNIGTRPTVDGTKQTIEINFFDFKQDLYGQKITISLLHRMRSEQKFESIDALKNQLGNDAKTSFLTIIELVGMNSPPPEITRCVVIIVAVECH
jgi:riboflavin kinase/FMN adenylyltransferase